MLNLWRKHPTQCESWKKKLSTCIQLETILNLKKSSQILKISCSCLIPTPNMIFASIGRDWRRNLLTQSYSTIKLLKDFKCIIDLHLMIYLGLSLRFLDFWRSSRTSKLITLQASDIRKLLAMTTNLKISVY